MHHTFIVAPTMADCRRAAERLFYHSDLPRMEQRMLILLPLADGSIDKTRGIRDAVLVITKNCVPRDPIVEVLKANAATYRWPVLTEQRGPW